jgi:hypothetical protein
MSVPGTFQTSTDVRYTAAFGEVRTWPAIAGQSEFMSTELAIGLIGNRMLPIDGGVAIEALN